MEIKGLILQARKEFVVDNFGEKAWERVLAALLPEDRERIEDMILTAKWYPFKKDPLEIVYPERLLRDLYSSRR